MWQKSSIRKNTKIEEFEKLYSKKKLLKKALYKKTKELKRHLVMKSRESFQTWIELLLIKFFF